jgi:hypothetical protein
VGLIVAAAAGYLLRQSWRSLFAAKAGCGGSCGCALSKESVPTGAGNGTFVPVEGLRLRQRPVEDGNGRGK